MLDARVRRIPLVLIADRLACMSEEDAVPVDAPRLQDADSEVLFDNRIGRVGTLDLGWRGAGAGVVSVDLLTQHRAFEGATRFSLLVQHEVGRKYSIRQQRLKEFIEGG